MTENPPVERSAELTTAHQTNRRLNFEKQRLESELAAYRRAVSQWEIGEHSTYIPLRTLAMILKVAGGDLPERWELHYERLMQAEAADEAHRLTVSEALGLGTGAPWDAIRDRATELQAAAPPADPAGECPQCGEVGACNGGQCPLSAPADRAAVLERVREWVTSDVVTATNEFGNGYREAQRDIRDLIEGRRMADEAQQVGRAEMEPKRTPMDPVHILGVDSEDPEEAAALRARLLSAGADETQQTGEDR